MDWSKNRDWKQDYCWSLTIHAVGLDSNLSVALRNSCLYRKNGLGSCQREHVCGIGKEVDWVKHKP